MELLSGWTECLPEMSRVSREGAGFRERWTVGPSVVINHSSCDVRLSIKVKVRSVKGSAEAT